MHLLIFNCLISKCIFVLYQTLSFHDDILSCLDLIANS